jgi:Protein of unknwon function (DUF3310)
MQNPIYQQPSKLGAPLLNLLHLPIDSTHDCITTIESCEVLYGYDFCHCSIVKYLWRLGEKDNIKKECDKILDYIDRAIANGSVITETLAIVRMEIECLFLRQS